LPTSGGNGGSRSPADPPAPGTQPPARPGKRIPGGTVVGRTGYQGAFDVDVEFTPGDAAGPSLAVALQEKLGLKLSGDKGL